MQNRMIKKRVKKAIFPVAGFGTRFLPATKAQPKEMLPVVGKPVIQYLVEEAVGAGIEEIIFVTGRGKRSIEDHFDHSFELEHTLVEKNKHDLLEKVRKISDMAKFSYIRQPLPLGDGDAIRRAAHLVYDEPVLVIFGDTLYDYEKKSPSQQLIEVFEKYGEPIVGLSRVEKEKVDKFGVVDGNEVEASIYQINQLVEKPKKEEAPSNLVAVGNYIITPAVFDVLDKMTEGKSGEIRLADAFDIMLKSGRSIFGKNLDGEWLDTGSKFNFMKAAIKLGLKDEELGNDLKKFIIDLSNNI